MLTEQRHSKSCMPKSCMLSRACSLHPGGRRAQPQRALQRKAGSFLTWGGMLMGAEPLPCSPPYRGTEPQVVLVVETKTCTIGRM